MKHIIRKAIVYLSSIEKTNQSHTLFYRALADYLSICGESVEDGKLEALYRMEEREGGKPYFPDHPRLHFSISHSGTCWSCVFAREEIGLDLQEDQLHIKAERIAKRFLHPSEWEWLSQNDYRDFCRLWAYKESYLKYTGEGIVGGLDSFSLTDLIRQVDASERREGTSRIRGASIWQKELPVKQGYYMVCTAQYPMTVCVKERF